VKCEQDVNVCEQPFLDRIPVAAQSRRTIMNRSQLLNLTGIVLLLALILLPARIVAQSETNAHGESAVAAEPSPEAMAALRAYLQLQGQLHEAQLAIDRTRQQVAEAISTNTAVMKSTEALAWQLRQVEERLADQRASDTKLTVIAVSGFAGICFIAVVVTAFFQWRVVNRLVQWPAALPARGFDGSSVPVAAIGSGSDALVSSVNIEQPNLRLLGAIERLEKRIQELEQAARAPITATAIAGTNGDHPNGYTSTSAPDAPVAAQDISERLKNLLDQGHALMNEEKPEAAIAVLDQALELDPENSEALVRKGSALEKLRKLNEAIDCYDRAIAADSSMTIAYLYKGGLYNRMERFSEAVECYEKALRTQEKKG
jgi:tetratricopeptide (TPR) repeat protein